MVGKLLKYLTWTFSPSAVYFLWEKIFVKLILYLTFPKGM